MRSGRWWPKPTAISRARRRGRWPRPIRQRQGTVLYVTAEVVRQIAILAQPAMPEASAKMLDILGIPDETESRNFAALGARIKPGTVLPPPAPVFPRYVEPAGLNGPSRCLSTAIAISIFRISPTISTASSARAEAAGIGRIVTISTRVRRLGGIARDHRAISESLLLGRHPSASGRRGRRHSRRAN